jgi:hypothetical protein
MEIKQHKGSVTKNGLSKNNKNSTPSKQFSSPQFFHNKSTKHSQKKNSSACPQTPKPRALPLQEV